MHFILKEFVVYSCNVSCDFLLDLQFGQPILWKNYDNVIMWMLWYFYNKNKLV